MAVCARDITISNDVSSPNITNGMNECLHARGHRLRSRALVDVFKSIWMGVLGWYNIKNAICRYGKISTRLQTLFYIVL